MRKFFTSTVMAATALSVSTLSYSQDLKDQLLTPAQVERDVSLAKDAFTRIHPGYDRFANEAELTEAWDAIITKSKSGMTMGEFYLDVSETLSKIRCDHTKAELPSALRKERKTSAVYLPFAWEMIGARAVVTNAADVKGLSNGDEIISIDGRTISDLQSALHKYIPVDGYNDHTKNVMMTESSEHMGGAVDHFGAFLFDPSETAVLKIKAESGETRTVEVSRVGHDERQKNLSDGKNSDFPNSITFESWGDKAAYLRIDSFINYRDPVKPGKLLDPIFQSLKTEGRDKLVLDLRNNGGGSTDVSHKLFSYFIDEKTQMKRAAIVKAIRMDGLEDYLWTWDKKAINPPKIAFKKTDEGEYALKPFFYEDIKKVKPSKLGFEGDLIILTSRSNSSGSTNFTSVVQAQRPVTLIGEKTGGNPEGPTAGIIFFMTLPETKVRLRLPAIRFENNIGDFVKGEGLVPDITVPTTLEDIINGIDPALEVAKKEVMGG